MSIAGKLTGQFSSRVSGRISIRPVLDVLIPGLYVWVVTCAWPLRAPTSTLGAMVFAGLAFLFLMVSGWLVATAHRLWSAVSVACFVSAAVAGWFLLGPDIQAPGLLGALGWAMFAVGWVRASGTQQGGEEGIEEGPSAVALSLSPRRKMPWTRSLDLGIRLVGVLFVVALAWGIEGRERSLLGHAVAVFSALQILAIAPTPAADIGRKAKSTTFPWLALARTLVVALLVLLGILLFGYTQQKT